MKLWWRILGRFHQRNSNRLRRVALRSQSARRANHYIEQSIFQMDRAQMYFRRIKEGHFHASESHSR